KNSSFFLTPLCCVFAGNVLMVKLLPFSHNDIENLISWVPSSEFLSQWAGSVFCWPLDRLQLEKHILKAKQQHPNHLLFNIMDESAQETIGYIELARIDHTNKNATIERVLIGSTQMRNRGIGKQVVEAILTIGFQNLNLHRIDLHVFDFNKQAITCYEGAGFKREGELRDFRRFGDKYVTLCIMSILSEEWHTRQRLVQI
ncbi:MAG: GNAT family protein, partial [Leadbetterella sp.]|nr:GNAT family protein [Leadbetterella sp.]